MGPGFEPLRVYEVRRFVARQGGGLFYIQAITFTILYTHFFTPTNPSTQHYSRYPIKYQTNKSDELKTQTRHNLYHADALEAEMRFKFLQYGIYVDLGTGKGYKRGNGGDLKFLGKDYRKEHNLGKAREPRPWFSKSWYISTQVIKDDYARFDGDKFVGIMDDLGK